MKKGKDNLRKEKIQVVITAGLAILVAFLWSTPRSWFQPAIIATLVFMVLLHGVTISLLNEALGEIIEILGCINDLFELLRKIIKGKQKKGGGK